VVTVQVFVLYLNCNLYLLSPVPANPLTGDTISETTFTMSNETLSHSIMALSLSNCLIIFIYLQIYLQSDSLRPHVVR